MSLYFVAVSLKLPTWVCIDCAYLIVAGFLAVELLGFAFGVLSLTPHFADSANRHNRCLFERFVRESAPEPQGHGGSVAECVAALASRGIHGSEAFSAFWIRRDPYAAAGIDRSVLSWHR